MKFLDRKVLAWKKTGNYAIAVEDLKKPIEIAKVTKDESNLNVFKTELSFSTLFMKLKYLNLPNILIIKIYQGKPYLI